MYNIFFNEKLILLTSEKPIDSINFEVIDFDKNLYFTSIINTRKKNIAIVGNDIEEIFKAFKRQFIYLETAGGIVTYNYKDFLFINKYGRWDLPKGKIEPNEEIEHAAIREVEEECGIKNLKIVRNFFVTFHIYFQNNYYHLKKNIFFLMETNFQNPIPQKEEEIIEAKWINLENIDKIRVSTYKTIIMLLDLLEKNFKY